MCFSIQDLLPVSLLVFLRSAIWEYVAVFKFQIFHKDNRTESKINNVNTSVNTKTLKTPEKKLKNVLIFSGTFTNCIQAYILFLTNSL